MRPSAVLADRLGALHIPCALVLLILLPSQLPAQLNRVALHLDCARRRSPSSEGVLFTRWDPVRSVRGSRSHERRQTQDIVVRCIVDVGAAADGALARCMTPKRIRWPSMHSWWSLYYVRLVLRAHKSQRARTFSHTVHAFVRDSRAFSRTARDQALVARRTSGAEES